MTYYTVIAIAAIISGSAFGESLVRGVDVAKLMHSCGAFSVKRKGADAYGARFDLIDGGKCVGVGQIGVYKNISCAQGSFNKCVFHTPTAPSNRDLSCLGDVAVSWGGRVVFCRDNVCAGIYLFPANDAKVVELALEVDKKLRHGGSGINRGEEVNVPIIRGLEFCGQNWSAILDFKLNGVTAVVDQLGIQAGSDDVSCGVCFVTDSCVVSDMLPVQKDELKRKRSLYCRMMNSGNERTMASPQAKYALSKKLCADLLHSAPDLYGQHLVILQIMNEGDSSCVSTLIPFTAPDKNSLLRQDAVRALGAVGSPAAVAHLVKMLKGPVVSRQYDEDEEAAILRREIVCALKRIGDVSALPVLESVASSTAEYKSVREMAQSAVELMKKPRASK